VKLGQITELLLAAGYFRVRIKGLSPFDKVLLIYMPLFGTNKGYSTHLYWFLRTYKTDFDI